MEQKINIFKEVEKVTVTLSLKRGKGYKFAKGLAKKLDLANIKYSVPFTGRSTLYRFENMYMKVYCASYEPATVDITMYKVNESTKKVLIFLLEELKEDYVDSYKNSIYLANYSKLKVKKDCLNVKLATSGIIEETDKYFFEIPFKVSCDVKVVDSNSRSSVLKTSYTENVNIRKEIYFTITALVERLVQNKEEFLNSIVVVEDN